MVGGGLGHDAAIAGRLLRRMKKRAAEKRKRGVDVVG